MTNKEIKSILEALPAESQYNYTCKFETNYQLNIEKLNLPSYNDQKTIKYNALYLMDPVGDDYTNNNDPPNIKYAMFVYDENNEDESDNELYLVIGQNPSRSSKKNIDGTNQNIYKALLSNNIHRYLLLNTFPIIDPDGANSKDLLKTDENIKITQQIIKCLREKSAIKIIYACGSSLPVYSKFIETLNTLINTYKIKTYAFVNGSELQTHLSMQALNSKPITPDSLKLVECKIEVIQPDEFKTVKFIKGDRQC